MRTSSLFATLAFSMIAVGLSGPAAAVPTCSADGHCYQASTDPDRPLPNNTWLGAATAAGTVFFNGQPGHLATLTSDAENSFVATSFGTFINSGAPWIGLSQSVVGMEPGSPAQGAAAGWEWITGEPFYSGAANNATDVIFENWNVGEPNNGLGGGEEDFGHLFAGAGGAWNDAPGSAILAFLVEFEPGASNGGVPEPSTLLLISSGLIGVGSIAWRRGRRK
jgi:PEP-CTERM motif-containing protein